MAPCRWLAVEAWGQYFPGVPSGGIVPNLGLPELLVILAILVLIFGARRLPQLGEGIGKAIRGLKRGLNTDDDIDVSPTNKRVSESSSAESVTKEVADAEVVEK